MNGMLHLSPSFKDDYGSRLTIVNKYVDDFIKQLTELLSDEEPNVRASIESYTSLLGRGGKRLRGVLTLTGYQLYGGDNLEMVGRAAAVIEAEHAYVLVMDDVADNSDSRRGGPTAHVYMHDVLVAANATGDLTKLGADYAQNAALIANHAAQAAFMQLQGVGHGQLMKAALILNRRLATTGVGQARDMQPKPPGEADLKYVLQTATLKTAYYSYLLPLEIGATLAGAPEKELEYFTAYAENAGLGFQLMDDIVGITGDEAITGKPPESDIKEGKNTVLVALAWKKASQTEKRVLERALGNPDLTNKDFQRCLEILTATGALEETRALAVSYVEKALATLRAAPNHWDRHHLQFLEQLAIYGVQRRN